MQAVNFDQKQSNLTFGEVIIDWKSVHFDWSAAVDLGCTKVVNFAVVNFDWH